MRITELLQKNSIALQNNKILSIIERLKKCFN